MAMEKNYQIIIEEEKPLQRKLKQNRQQPKSGQFRNLEKYKITSSVCFYLNPDKFCCISENIAWKGLY